MNDENALPYSVPHAAADLMLDPAEMKDIFDAFLLSASKKIDAAGKSTQSGDWQNWSSNMHALKGVALSLHMNRLGGLAAEAERMDPASPDLLTEIVGKLENELLEIRGIVEAFYQAGI